MRLSQSRAALSSAALAAALLLASCGGADPAAEAGPEAPAGSVAEGESRSPVRGSEPGAYIGWSDYEADAAAYAASDVVLFFHASWCPTCQAAEQSIEADGVPSGLTIVKVDFDENIELRRRYGVTVQHTYVQVDASGDKVKAWTGSTSAADIARQVV